MEEEQEIPTEKEISEELERYSLELSEDEISLPREELKVPSAEQLPEKQQKFSTDKHAGKVVRYMNTYRLESRKPFNEESVTAVLEEVLTRDLATAHYEPNNMTKMCVALAGEIRNKVKLLNYDRFKLVCLVQIVEKHRQSLLSTARFLWDADRYKLVCLVQIVEKHRQSLLSTARFLWDADRDRYAAFSLNNAHIAAMACVFGIYYE